MWRFKQYLAAACILVPVAGMLSTGCGLFVLPVAGPKALVTNAQRIQFTLDVVDIEGNRLTDVQIEVRKYAADADLMFGEVEKTEMETRTAAGQFAYDGFGKYAVGVTISKPGYGQVVLLCANSDKVDRLHPPGFMARLQMVETKVVNVQQNPLQHVVLSRVPESPAPAPPARP